MTASYFIVIIVMSLCSFGFAQPGILEHTNAVKFMQHSNTNNSFHEGSSINPLILQGMLSLTNMEYFASWCSHDEYKVTIFASRAPFAIIEKGESLNVVVNGCREIQVSPVQAPVMAVVSQANVMIWSYDNYAAGVTKVTVQDSIGGGIVVLSEINQNGHVIVTEKNETSVPVEIFKREGVLDPRRFLRFCMTLELLNVRWLENSRASGGLCREVRIHRGDQVQILRWPLVLDDGIKLGDGFVDARYGSISLVIDGLMDGVAWKDNDKSDGIPAKDRLNPSWWPQKLLYHGGL